MKTAICILASDPNAKILICSQTNAQCDDLARLLDDALCKQVLGKGGGRKTCYGKLLEKERPVRVRSKTERIRVKNLLSTVERDSLMGRDYHEMLEFGGIRLALSAKEERRYAVVSICWFCVADRCCYVYILGIEQKEQGV